MVERRKKERCNLAAYSIIVFDLDKAAGIGRLETLATGGFLLLSKQPIVIDEVRRISMSMPKLANRKSVIRCEARSLWGDNIPVIWDDVTGSAHYYQTGFEFIDLDEYHSQTIELLIEKLATDL